MRLAYFADTPRIGGAERFLVNVVAGAAAAGNAVTVISPQTALLELIAAEAPAAAVVLTGPCDLYSLGSRRRKLEALLRSLPAVGRALARVECDLLHVNNGGYPGSELCRLTTALARLARVPSRLLTVHSAPWPRSHAGAAPVDLAVWRCVDGVHATSEFVRERLTELRGLPRRLGRCVPYGVDEPAGAAEAPGLHDRLGGSGLLVGMIAATADRQKGHGVLLEALAGSNPGLKAAIVGPVPSGLPGELHRLGLEGRVSLVGAVAPGEVGAYTHACDVLVVPSTAYESLPLVVLEAMAAGKPVLASRLSGIPEAVLDGETGRLFTPGAAGELSALLDEAAADPARLAELGAAGRLRWEARFSVEQMVSAMLSLYSELAVRPR